MNDMTDMSDIDKKLMGLIKSEEFNNYMTCLEGSVKHKKQIKQIRKFVDELSLVINELATVQASKDINKILQLALKTIQNTKKILNIETNREMMTYGAQQCTTQLVDFNMLKNKIQQENLESMENQITMAIQFMASKAKSAPPPPKSSALTKSNKTRSAASTKK
jgi:hypothetical protein